MTDVIVAGHLCLDIIPDLSAHAEGQFDVAFQPGRLVHVGAASISTGGAVANTGLALHRLGIETRLLARVGADQFGRTVKQTVAEHAPALADGITISAETSTSYSLVISPPGSDRRFLHHPGANDDFCFLLLKQISWHYRERIANEEQTSGYCWFPQVGDRSFGSS